MATSESPFSSVPLIEGKSLAHRSEALPGLQAAVTETLPVLMPGLLSGFAILSSVLASAVRTAANGRQIC